MGITEVDVQNIVSLATRRAAQAAGLEVELMLPQEIPGALQIQSPDLASTLDAFVQAYRAWFDFLVDTDEPLSSAAKVQLMSLLRDREATRNQLVSMADLPTAETARVWKQNHLDPLLSCLDFEIPRLESHNWSWRFHSEACELIVPLADVVHPLVSTESALTAPLRNAVRAHDQAVERLIAALGAAQKRLERDPQFQAAVNRAKAEHASAHARDEPWGGFNESKLTALSAEFVLNAVEEVAPGASTMERFWNARRQQILAVVDLKTLMASTRREAMALRPLADQLRAATHDLSRRLNRIYGSANSGSSFGF